MNIVSRFRQLLKIPSRLENVIQFYLLYLLLDGARRTLQGASDLSGLDSSQFSRLLSNHQPLAWDQLNRQCKRRLKSILKARKQLVSGSPWTVALIVDATLHERSSRHSDNAQRFNHGQGWIVGHQWTNLILSVNGQRIPLPPIPFLTEKKCKELGQEYKTESKRIIEYLRKFDWKGFLPTVRPEEIVVLSDSGYDNKALQRFILSQGWGFVGSIKKTRSVRTQTQEFQSVEELFQNTRKIGPWKTIRHRTNGGKKRKLANIRTLIGSLKGVHSEVAIVSAEKPNKQRIYLGCSRSKLDPGIIARLYKLRWSVELFHREVKSYLGFEDAGLTRFEAIHSHVLWVYSAYLLLPQITSDLESGGLLARKQYLQKILKKEEMGKILKLNGRFDSKEAVKNYCSQVKEELEAA
jgi:hypothetical protein